MLWTGCVVIFGRVGSEFAMSVPAAAAPTAEVAPVQELRLDNGLALLSQEIHHAPIISFYVWYRVGARNEVPGMTGISHWVEHMQFKGTPSLKKGEIDRLVDRNGGVKNAFTSQDYTAYFETLPSDKVDLALRIEADRMVNSLFDAQETESERTVIISEREGAENSPWFWLQEESLAAAFKAHPYGLPLVGWKSDLRQITRDELYGYYRSWYCPNNAVAVAVGDFATDDLRRRVERAFGAIPARQLPEAQVRSQEPPQEGERRVLVRRPGAVPLLLVCYHVPDGSHPDNFSVRVAAAVLGAGRTSRLYRALVVGGLASSASAGAGMSRDPHLLSASVTLKPGVERERVEEVTLAEVERLAQEEVSAEELTKVKRQLRSGYLFGIEGVSSRAHMLGHYEVVHTYRAFERYLDDLAEVTPADVLRVAAAALKPDNRTVGWFVPTTQ